MKKNENLSLFVLTYVFVGHAVALPVTGDSRQSFGSVDDSDGAKAYAPRSSWSAEITEIVKDLEALYVVDDYQPLSLRKSDDAPEPTRVYRCPVPEVSGFGNSGQGTGWGFPVDSVNRE